jgi:hypothetical protein
MVLSWSRLQKSCRFFPSVLKQYFFIFLGMHLINLFFNQLMIYLQVLRMTSKDDMYIPVMLVIALIGFIVQSIIRTVWTFIICHFFKNKNSLQEFLRRHLELGLIESLRAFFRAVLWGFVFIFPGFHKFFQYQFVLYIVGLDDSYDRGEKDVLAESVRLSKGHLFALSILLTGFALISLVTTSGEFILSNPLQVVTMESVGFLLMTLESIYLLFLFQDISAEKAHA